MLTEKGTLPIGVERNGEHHRDFEIREQLVADSIDVYEMGAETVDRAERNPAFFGLCILSRQIVSLGGIPREEISPALLLGMTQTDFNALRAASARLEERRRSFLEEE